MPVDVQEAIKTALVEDGRLSEVETSKMLKDMETRKRLQFETWS